jgi:hypothetical protein
MIMGTDERLALELINQRGAELRADVERFRLARLARRRTTCAEPAGTGGQPRVAARPKRVSAR